MNETTFLEKRPTVNGQNEGNAWKHVTLSGVTGILMGAGLLYAGQMVAATMPEENTMEKPEDGTAISEEQSTESPEVENTFLPVAQLHNDLPFGEAFAAARAEVGPGGVFIWHGGIYGTYTADEWDSMTQEQKNDFALKVNPEISVNDIPTPTDVQPDIVAQPVVDNLNDVQVVDEQTAQDFEQDGDVHIVGYANVEGHLAVGYDTTGDGQVDVAIIDVDDDHQLSDADIIVDNQGNVATIGEVMNADDPNLQVAMENPDVAPDMPDYMNDALFEA